MTSRADKFALSDCLIEVKSSYNLEGDATNLQ